MRDLVVIGGGPGGYVAAIRACQLGMKVTLIEKDALGGTCLNRGCIPTKAYQYNAKLLKSIRDSREFGITTGSIQFDMQEAKARKNTIVNNLAAGVKKLLQQNNAEIINGEAFIINQHHVRVREQLIETKNILIATGSKPAFLPIKGIDSPGVLNSEDILELSHVPERLVIIGGGVIGMEFACIFNLFGSEVTVIESAPRILGLLDAELSKRMLVYLKKQKITIHTNTLMQEIILEQNGLQVLARGSKGDITLNADLVLLAAGRIPVTECLQIKGAEVEMSEGGFIKVNQHYQTSLPGIYAVGDVIGGQLLAHVASEEGIAAVEHMAGINTSVPYHSVPSCIFTIPEIATVGMSEEEAKAQGIDYKTGKFQFAANGKAMTMGETDGLVKVIADQNEIIIGLHIIGPNASDLILEGTITVKNHMTVSDLVGTIHPHPTLGEALSEAARDIRGEAIHLAPKRK
ncbi:MAG: dihydrolipoyl dehydrogenase [Syntrophomonadaceae bacterium]|nr:dihydrolipoyl dehydrogenase [Syntrophomonadaceae bacterium]